jgi:hypothetical protein
VNDQTEPVSELSVLDMSQLTSYYIQLRDAKKEVADRHKQELEPYTTAMSQIEAEAMDRLRKSGQESAKTATGTCYISTVRSYKLEDPAEFDAWVTANERTDLYERRLAKSPLEELLADNGGVLPPGVGVSSMSSVNFRSPTKK